MENEEAGCVEKQQEVEEGGEEAEGGVCDRDEEG